MVSVGTVRIHIHKPGLKLSLIHILYEVAGEWESRSGSPRVRIYRNPGRRGGGFYVEVSYKDGTRFSRPVRKYWGGIRYFDLYGYVALAYDAGREVLQLSAYGDYYRASE